MFPLMNQFKNHINGAFMFQIENFESVIKIINSIYFIK